MNDLTSIIDSAISAGSGAYIASQATSAPTYLPGQNLYSATTGSNNFSSILLLAVVAFIGLFAWKALK